MTMTRNEEILKAARDYVSGVSLSSPSNFIHFAAGARWADERPNLESLWHDATDNPTEATLILYRTTSGECEVTELVCTSEGVWHLFVKEYEVAEWAYIEDLLPKGGER